MDRQSRTGQTLALGYGRLSKNRGGVSNNVAIQHREVDEYTQDEGWKRGAWFEDEDISASRFSDDPRPGYDELIDFIKNYTGTAKLVIVVTEMERLYRRVREVLDLIDLAERTQLTAIHATDGEVYDLSTPNGIDRAIGAVSKGERESRKLSQRQRRKKRDQAEAGKWSGGGRTYGYEPDGVTIRESEATVIRLAVRKLIAGESQTDVLRWMNRNGYFTVSGKPWMIGNLIRTLTKKRYIGIREHRPENGDPPAEYPAVWPAIITPEDYEQMMAQINGSRQPWSHGPIQGRTYVLSGKIRCVCGSAMYGQNRKMPDDSRQRRYRCRKYDNHGEQVGCGKVYRAADPLEDMVKELVFYMMDTPEIAAFLAHEDNREEVEDLTRKLNGLRARRKQLASDHARGLYEREDYAVMVQTIKADMDALQAELSKLQGKQRSKLVPTEPLREVWDQLSIDRQRTITDLLIEYVEVLPGHPRSKKYKHWRFDIETVNIVSRFKAA